LLKSLKQKLSQLAYIQNHIKSISKSSGARRKFSWGGWFRVIWWSFVFGVRCLWRHNLTSCSCIQTNVLAKFV